MKIRSRWAVAEILRQVEAQLTQREDMYESAGGRADELTKGELTCYLSIGLLRRAFRPRGNGHAVAPPKQGPN